MLPWLFYSIHFWSSSSLLVTFYVLFSFIFSVSFEVPVDLLSDAACSSGKYITHGIFHITFSILSPIYSVQFFLPTSSFFCWVCYCKTLSLECFFCAVYLTKFLLERIVLLWILYKVFYRGYNNLKAVIMLWCPLFLSVILVCSNIRQSRPAAHCGHSESSVPLKMPTKAVL